jgi:tetratricopeptide (TPR) repeat protein
MAALEDRMDDPTFKRAKEAFDRGNKDYTVELLKGYIQKNPTDTAVRNWLRAVELLRLREGKKPGIFERGKVKLIVSKAQAATAARKHETAMSMFEDALAMDPHDLGALKGLGKAALEGDYPTAAIDALELVRDQSPKDADSMRMLARAYEKAGNKKLALNRWDMVSQLDPNDREAREKQSQLSGELAIDEGKWENSQSFQDQVVDKENAREAERRGRIMDEADLDRAIHNTRKKIEEEPDRAGHYLNLANFLMQKKKFKSAQDVIKQGIERDPVNYQFKVKLGEIEQAAYKNELAKVDAKLEQNPDDEKLGAKRDRIEEARVKHLIETLEKHTKNQPADKNFPYELGKLLYDRGNYDQAIGYLQDAQHDPRWRTDCRRLLGHCMLAKDLHKLAINNYDQALEEAEGMTDTVKEILYYRGQAYEEMDDDAKALESYEKIFTADINYRDVKDKVEELYRKQSSQKT